MTPSVTKGSYPQCICSILKYSGWQPIKAAICDPWAADWFRSVAHLVLVRTNQKKLTLLLLFILESERFFYPLKAGPWKWGEKGSALLCWGTSVWCLFAKKLISKLCSFCNIWFDFASTSCDAKCRCISEPVKTCLNMFVKGRELKKRG